MREKEQGGRKREEGRERKGKESESAERVEKSVTD